MQQVTKQVIEVQKRMEELIQATDRVSERLGGAAGGGQRFPTFPSSWRRALQPRGVLGHRNERQAI